MSGNKDFPWWLPLWLFIAVPCMAVYQALGGKIGKAEENTEPKEESK